ncbi:hypothetical protein [Companilactobacillus bobalius]|uniref:Uncharacterized protein n=2 Tax=Companilactobacillus bobalius TaxID=2801451 RepID=A0A202F5Q5_9LACO|nr:hypothetical protein [Companilactobacillus bobalius]KAE9560682.1 hypothetical protein ATN92_11140 [Companilactobacillus bobalius]KRK85024.1 hypothetical protein FC78_GL000824 [Companilactobacillus bobalius DSM 19674]OVE95812.1 hypothetical protein LKACC16343_02564 [Companilactobacillus bobalius]
MTKTHLKSKHPLYGVWNGMKQRCNNPNQTKYKNYGARGIHLCENWQNNFETFFNWSILNGYSYGLTIDRIDVNGNYEPNNCRWVSQKVQQNNRSNNHLITDENGVTKTLAEWADSAKVTEVALARRIKNGMSVNEAITKGNLHPKFITINGETHNLKEWGAIKGYRRGLIPSRIERGWNPVKAVLTPPRKGNYVHS